MRGKRSEWVALKREVQRLRKELKRREESLAKVPAPEEEGLNAANASSERNALRGSCPRCHEKLEYIELGQFTYRFCQDRTKCKFREKIP